MNTSLIKNNKPLSPAKTIGFTLACIAIFIVVTSLAASQADANQIIAAFKLTSHNLLLTGGNFGIEASLPCFVLYILVIVALRWKMGKKGLPNNVLKGQEIAQFHL